MNPVPRTIANDIAEWELPSLIHKLGTVIDELQHRLINVVRDADWLEEALWELWDPLAEAGASAANEVITGWLQGVDSDRPELTVQWAFLDDGDERQALCLNYCVTALDGQRMVLREVDLEELLNDALYRMEGNPRRVGRLSVICEQLRVLGEAFERQLGDSGSGREH